MLTGCRRSRRTLRLKTGWMALCLTLCAGCSPAPMVQVVRTPPPASLLSPCDRPEPGALVTNRDLAAYASRLDLALSFCAARMDALRAFFESENEKKAHDAKKKLDKAIAPGYKPRHQPGANAPPTQEQTMTTTTNSLNLAPNANLRGLDLRKVNLTNANLAFADLRGADLRGVDLSGTNLNGADLTLQTVFLIPR